MSSKPAPEPGRPWSIAARLTAWNAAAAFGLVLVVTGYLYWALTLNLDREDDQFLSEKLHAAEHIVSEHPGDRLAIERWLQSESEKGSRFLFGVTLPGAGQDRIESPGLREAIPGVAFPQVGKSGDASSEFRAADGRAFRLRSHRDEKTGAVIQVAMDTSNDDELLEDFRRRISYVLVLSLVAVAIGGYGIARRGVRPIARAAATAQRIRPAHLDERIATAGLPAEIREFAGTFNLMLDRLEDAFTRLGRFSADIAHELRTPVNNLRGEAEVALGRPRSAEEYRETLSSCLEECGRLTQLIDSLLFLARAENPKTELARKEVDLATEMGAVVEMYAPAAADAGVQLVVEAGLPIALMADRALLQQALGNLVANALAHTPRGGAVVAFAGVRESEVRVGVRDSGQGIAPEHLPFVFERFYRADPARASDPNRVGLGFGLAIVKAIAELHGGRVEVDSTFGKGATITMILPCRSPASPSV